jgi:hypothetical protein
LQELIDGASGNEPVTSLLRKVKVVASRADMPALDEWVQHELGGYFDEDADLPDYRGPFKTEILGSFSGRFGSGIRNAPIPSALFPEDYRDGMLFNVAFPQPIAEIEDLASAKDGIRITWPANAIAVVNGLMMSGRMRPIYEGMGLTQAWHSIGTHQLIGIVDAVRNRILDLALTIERVSPETGQPNAPPLPDETRQVVITNIYGNSTNVAVASADFTQVVHVATGDAAALARALDSVGVPAEQIESLFEALEADGPVHDEMGPNTKNWLGNLMAGAAQLGIGAAGGVIAEAIAHYLGVS